MICLVKNVNTSRSSNLFGMNEATDRGKKEECVQYPAGLSEMDDMDRAPRCCKVTAAAGCPFTSEIGLKMSFRGGRRKETV